MATVIGFDFGTHQTKVCIANNDDPRNVTYDFLEFTDPISGKKGFVLPSLVQINTDKTISYGFANRDNCLSLSNPRLAPKPFQEIPMPKEIQTLPPEPQEPAGYTRAEVVQRINEVNSQRKKQKGKKGIPLTEEKIAEATRILDKKRMAAYKTAHREWEQSCLQIKQKYEKECRDVIQQNKWREEVYERELSESQRMKPQYYQNFKFTTFTGSDTRNFLTGNQLSLLYITYILFLLEERYGQDFSIQFGVPASPNTYKQQRTLATRLILRAYKLVENVFENDIDKFLASDYETLVALSELPEFSEEIKDEYGIIILPEASACLKALADAGKLTENKLHLMMDIGGGTTDISFFGVVNHSPKIYWFKSIPYGLNFTRENPKNVQKYREEIRKTVDQLQKELFRDFAETGMPKKYMDDGIDGDILVYNGGGSSENGLCQAYGYFKTVRRIRDILPIRFKEDDVTKLCHILSNSYGLSNQVGDEESSIKLHPFEDILKVYKQQVRAAKIQNTSQKNEYEHGLSDLN